MAKVILTSNSLSKCFSEDLKELGPLYEMKVARLLLDAGQERLQILLGDGCALLDDFEWRHHLH